MKQHLFSIALSFTSRVQSEPHFTATGFLALSLTTLTHTSSHTFSMFLTLLLSHLTPIHSRTNEHSSSDTDTLIDTDMHTTRAPLFSTMYPGSYGEHFKDTGPCNLPAISAACALAPHLLKLNKVEAKERRPWP